MAHEVETMAYFGEKPWHGLGNEMTQEDCFDWQSACRRAGLDWEVEKIRLATADEARQQVDYYAVRRTSDQKILGAVGPRYTVLQNRDAFAWFSPWLEAKEASLHTCGALRQGSRVWV